MTADDISRIETSLQIELPDVYRRLLLSFPLRAYAGNVDMAFWDDADRLIQLNRELRSGADGVKPWPAHYYALSRDDGGCSQAIDLRTGELWWADRGHLDASGSYKHPEPFGDWATACFEGLGTDLTGEGGDPSGTPAQRTELEARNSKASARFSGWLLLFIVLAISMVVLWRLLRNPES